MPRSRTPPKQSTPPALRPFWPLARSATHDPSGIGFVPIPVWSVAPTLSLFLNPFSSMELPQMSDEQVTQSENQSTDSPSTDAPAKTRQMSFEVLESGEIRADFGKGLEPLLLNPALVPEHIIAAAVTEGLISRTRGYTSKLSADDRTPEALRAAVEKGFAALLAGTWKIERVAGGSADYP